MIQVRREPCVACPYRLDVPSGVWSFEDYAKLPPYDGETFEQPPTAFRCHATPDSLCHGWAVVGGEGLLGLRLQASLQREYIEIPEPAVPLFATHREAAKHGMKDINRPSDDAHRTMERLTRKYPRLRENNEDE